MGFESQRHVDKYEYECEDNKSQAERGEHERHEYSEAFESQCQFLNALVVVVD